MKSSFGGRISDRSGLFDVSDILAILDRMAEFDDDEALKRLQILLDFCSRGFDGDISTWQIILIELLKLITDGTVRDQNILLSGQVFFSILSQIMDVKNLENHLKLFLVLNSHNLQMFGDFFFVRDQEMLKFIIINSCLSVSKQKATYSKEIYSDILEIVEKHCITYTRYTYIAFRLLNLLLECTKHTNYWEENSGILEGKLEAIIMSNWDNCINDVAKLNATGIFPKYLNIMERKYPNFLEKSFDILLNQLSWQNPTKYTILTEMFKVMKSSPRIDNQHIATILESLPKYHLKHVSTKLYLTVWGTLDEENWLEFYNVMHSTIKMWEVTNNTSSLQFVWELWFKPTLKNFSNNIYYILWHFLFKNEMIVSQSFFVKLAIAKGIKLMSLFEYEKSRLKEESKSVKSISRIKNIWIKNESNGVPFVLEDERECVRLNGFSIYCSGTVFKSVMEYNDFINNDCASFNNNDNNKNENNEKKIDYKICECFLYFNVRTTSVNSRKGIIDNLKSFVEKIFKADEDDGGGIFLKRLHIFVRNCFEMGSCYQRRIIGLSIYEILLQSMKIDYSSRSHCNRKKNSKIINIKFEESINECRRQIYDIETFYDLTRLCLDPVDDVREKACNILSIYFNENIQTEENNKILFQEAMKYCRSSKFYEVSGGGKLLKVFIKMTGKDLSKYLYEEMKLQLCEMKKDILKATAQGSPFYGIIVALLETHFNKDIVNETQINDDFSIDLLNVLEEASVFFLSSLSPKSEETKYSASFAEMGIAIEERINSSGMRYTKYEECILSPAHQTILSCIWMSLASICNLAGELTYVNTQKKEIYIRSIDIVIKILMKCRHKGVIESAGSVLVRLMKNKNIGYEYFLNYLKDLLSLDSHDKINLTRRGAGQTIMFHRLIANDDKKNRPLLQIAMQTLLMNLKKNSSEIRVKSKNSKQDNPLARQLHFLHRIVADKSLHSHLVEYMEEISLICLDHLTSPEWSVRNASLQLLGAVIPRVAGQCSDGELDFSTGYSIGHFLTHYPNLAIKILLYFREKRLNDYKTIIIPILTLLSKMSFSGCNYIEYSSNEYIEELKHELYLLFKHPVAMVRNLAAKSYASLIPFYKIGHILFCMANTNLDGCNDNFRHSYFSIQMYLQIRAKYELLRLNADDAMRIRDGTNYQLNRLNFLFERWCSDRYNINYIVESTFVKSLLSSTELRSSHTFAISTYGHYSICNKIQHEENRPGFWEFIDRLVEIHWYFTDSLNCSQVFYNINQYSICMMKYAQKNIAEKDCNSWYTEQSSEQQEQILLAILKELYTIIEKNDQRLQAYFPEIFAFIIKILENRQSTKTREKVNLSSQVMRIIEKLVESKNKLLQRLGYFMAATSKYQFNDNQFKNMAFEFISHNIRNEDEVGKFWALDCLEKFLNNTKFIEIEEDIIQLRIIESLVSLLNDQVPEIRNCVNQKMMYFELMSVKSPLHQLTLPKISEIYLYQVLKSSVLSHSCTHKVNSHKWFKDLITSIISGTRYFNRKSGDITSPFEYDELYREDGKIINVLTEFILNSMTSSNEGVTLMDDKFHITEITTIGNRYQEEYITKLMNTNSSKLLTILNMKIEEYLLHKIQTLYNIIGDKKLI